MQGIGEALARARIDISVASRSNLQQDHRV
jgi:hypothetical protein